MSYCKKSIFLFSFSLNINSTDLHSHTELIKFLFYLRGDHVWFAVVKQNVLYSQGRVAAIHVFPLHHARDMKNKIIKRKETCQTQVVKWSEEEEESCFTIAVPLAFKIFHMFKRRGNDDYQWIHRSNSVLRQRQMLVTIARYVCACVVSFAHRSRSFVSYLLNTRKNADYRRHGTNPPPLPNTSGKLVLYWFYNLIYKTFY